jgi:SAM-dependent methyltransferase
MHDLIALAEKEHWLTAVRRMFKDSNPELYDYVADLNRASWIPILPVDPASTVLDVSAGLGALTHALALNYQHVVAVDPVAELVRFTKVRLEREGLSNVDFIHTTLDALPFEEGTFDLIALNGVLEWVREEAQIGVLQNLRRLLKPHGVLVIGSENRIGYTSLLRRTDHPRGQFPHRNLQWLASIYQRLRKPGFYWSLRDTTKGRGRSTHTPHGYSSLLRQAGFALVDLWWPPNGYNSPHVILKASNRAAIESYSDFDRRYKDRIHGYGLARQLRHFILVNTRLIHRMLPDVLMIASPGSEGEEELHRSVPLLAAFQEHLGRGRYYVDSLMTHPYKNKSVLKVVSCNSESHAVVKVANVRLPGAGILQRSYEKLERLHSRFTASDPSLAGSIPLPMGVVQVGSLFATMEGSARGSRLVDLMLERQYFDGRARVRRHLERITTWLIASKPTLDALGSDRLFDAIPSEWLVAPEAVGGGGHGASPEVSSGAQHGDFYPENIFLDEESQHVCVIDWDGCGTGYPPLFDWFCLITGLYYTHESVRGLPKGQTVEFLSFRQTYFEASWFSELVLSLSHRLCDSFGLDAAKLLDYFLLYIVVRYRQFLSHSELEEKHYWGTRNRDLYKQYYEFLLENRKRCCFANAPAPGLLRTTS